MIKEMDFTYKKGGTTLYFREERNALVCVDIDIEPGSKIAYFCFNKKFNVQLRTTLKQFPWVTNLYIDKTVLDMPYFFTKSNFLRKKIARQSLAA